MTIAGRYPASTALMLAVAKQPKAAGFLMLNRSVPLARAERLPVTLTPAA